MKLKPFAVLVAVLFSSVAAQAQFARTSIARSADLQLEYAVMTVAPLPPLPTFTVVTGTHLRILAPRGATDGNVTWFKNNAPLALNGAMLDLANVTNEDSGFYYAIVTTGTGSRATEFASVLVTHDGPRLLNISNRGYLNAAQPLLITGFVVERSPGNVSVLVRGVGPTLARLGVPDVLAAPELAVIDETGRRREPSGSPARVDTATKAVGAFPLEPGGRDIARLYLLPSGSYTVHLSSADGGSGTALIEVYEVPQWK